ncbi:alanine--tRNA ligase [Candidatus Phytoplasma sacchari]|uniref:Alanine--tRNA ligase n=1 Tax=Candidatus Phytoplasma sacchari TaxID=2609813 RepID=A0ABY7M101_9MOLU|nr:alanine--tRNA ligase [Candidatus Phytoplasma sacchari]
MKKLTSNQIRRMWIDFFISHSHFKENSFSLIPEFDPSLLWINAGITPLKKYFNGSLKTPFKRIVNIQKCLRTNDIEKIGKTSIHHTFFEMLGNFSIGDYFKEEAIDLAYELLISEKWFSIPKKKLYITYFENDKDTYFFWLKKGIQKSNLISLKNNFWQIGEGPCGPCTEIFFDRGVDYDIRGKELIIEGTINNRFIEIWNIVFSQYNCEKNLTIEQYKQLPNKNIDTGAGLERLSCIFQNVNTNFDTDLFIPIIKEISFLSKLQYKDQINFKIIADHIRALVFCIADGAIFSNLGRGYVLKRILRRAFLNGKKIGFSKPFLFKLVSSVINIMEEFYPYLREKESLIQNIIFKEEEKFLFHLKNGEKFFLKMINNDELSGKNFFKLYDTFGIPKEDILDYAEKMKIKVDVKEFDFLLQKQKDLSRNYIKNDSINNSINRNISFSNFDAKSEFVGYNKYDINTKIIKVFDEGIVLEKTPFYATSGGQISDHGLINNIHIKEVIKLQNGQYLHKMKKPFIFSIGQKVLAQIDVHRRFNISCNHTATHLLMESLKLVLGKHIKQQGSFLDNKILRFDFNHYKNISPEELIKVEDKVNFWIKKEYPVFIKFLSLKDIKENNYNLNNENFYKNKEYSEQDLFRIVDINNISSQLCCGTHVENTKKIKKFAIFSYEVIGSGIHRIEASTFENVSHILANRVKPLLLEEKKILQKINKMKDFILSKIDFFSNEENILKIFNQELSSFIKNNNSYRYVQNYKEYLIFLREKLILLQKTFIKCQTKFILKKAKEFIPIKIEKDLLILIEESENIDQNMIKILLEYLFDKLSTNFLCLCQRKKEKLFFMCKSNFLDLNDFMIRMKKEIKFKGGGKKSFIQGIIDDLSQIDQFLSSWRKFL